MSDTGQPQRAVLKSRMLWASAGAAGLAALAGFVAGTSWPQRLFLAGSFGTAVGLVGLVAFIGRLRVSTVSARLDARIRKLDKRTSNRPVAVSSAEVSLESHPKSPTPTFPPGPPRVTVVITTFNQSRFIRDALNSVLTQTWTDFECIVVDADSTDRTLEEAFDVVGSDPRFVMVSLEENDGPSVARNVGLARAKGEYVTFLDGDDFLYRDAIEQRLGVLSTETDRGWVAGSFCLWHSIPEDARLATNPPKVKRKRSDVSWFDTVTGAPFIVSAPLLRRDVLLAHGGFDTNVPSAEDTLLWSRLLRAGWIVRCVNSVGIAYRQRRHSWYRVSRSEHSARTEAIVRGNTQSAKTESVGPGPHRFTQDYAKLTAQRAGFERALIEIVGAVETMTDEELEPVLGDLTAGVQPWMTRAIDIWDTVDRAALRLSRYSEEGLSVRRAELRTRTLKLLSPLLDTNPVTGTPQSVDAPMAPLDVDPGGHRAVVLRSLQTAKWMPGRMASESVVLLPSAAYHLDEILPLARELQAHDMNTHILVSSKRWNNVRVGLRKAGDIPVSTYNPETFVGHDEVVARSSAVVTMNDWGEDRQFLELAMENGVPGFAKVEGVQDFKDDDIGRDRRAYQTAEYILAQGRNDLENTRPAAFVVGSTRLERIWMQPAVEVDSPRAVINLNFTYGVLSEVREAWLETATEACRSEGIPYVVSLHPAERGSIAERHPIAEEPIRHELTRSTVLISRFSTVPFEAMARGVPFIYHNPHGERVPTFAEPNGAFPIARSVDELRSALRQVAGWRGNYRDRAGAFFAAQIDIDPSRSSEVRAAEVVAGLARGENFAPDREAVSTPLNQIGVP